MVIGDRAARRSTACAAWCDGWHHPRPLRLRGRAERRGRHLRLVRRERRAAGISRGGQGGGHGPARTIWKQEAAKQKPGEHGLLALDWWNGNRSMLVDVDLSGLLVGATLATRAPDIYRALIEATAYGTRVIIEAFEKQRRAGHARLSRRAACRRRTSC